MLIPYEASCVGMEEKIRDDTGRKTRFRRGFPVKRYVELESAILGSVCACLGGGGGRYCFSSRESYLSFYEVIAKVA